MKKNKPLLLDLAVRFYPVHKEKEPPFFGGAKVRLFFFVHWVEAHGEIE